MGCGAGAAGTETPCEGGVGAEALCAVDCGAAADGWWGALVLWRGGEGTLGAAVASAVAVAVAVDLTAVVGFVGSETAGSFACGSGTDRACAETGSVKREKRSAPPPRTARPRQPRSASCEPVCASSAIVGQGLPVFGSAVTQTRGR